ncbi:hypothetical protein RND71_015992 [Anisodus tanguticus]|uniref:Uncharacterized protein n=1 Tax=Anisodus tanguticus TaxID=243964 RepID=A0AAE1S5B2_9SOLA|nr:hypothetical protein RND71_015992 [Anisodus tanguticus]
MAPRTGQSRTTALESTLKASKEKGSKRMRSQPVRSRMFDKDVLVDVDIVVDDDVVEDEVEKSSLVRKNSKNKKFEKRKIVENDVTEDEVDKLEKEDVGQSEKERKEILRSQKVLLGRVFDFDIVVKFGMNELLEIVEFQKWTRLFVPPAPKLFEAEVGGLYANLCYTDDYTLVTYVNGKDFELDEVKIVNKVLLLRAEGRSITSITDLVLLEALSTFNPISLLAFMIEHMVKVVNAREGKHGLPYGFFLTKILEHFKGGVGRNSTVLTLIKAQEKSIAEIQWLKAENALLRVQLVEKAHELGSSGVVEAANVKNTNLRAEE